MELTGQPRFPAETWKGRRWLTLWPATGNYNFPKYLLICPLKTKLLILNWNLITFSFFICIVTIKLIFFMKEHSSARFFGAKHFCVYNRKIF